MKTTNHKDVGYFDRNENIIFKPETDEWGLVEGTYYIIKNGKVNIGWSNEPNWIDGILFWTTYGAGEIGEPYGAGWTQDESATPYKTTKRKLPEGGRWAIVKN